MSSPSRTARAGAYPSRSAETSRNHEGLNRDAERDQVLGSTAGGPGLHRERCGVDDCSGRHHQSQEIAHTERVLSHRRAAALALVLATVPGLSGCGEVGRSTASTADPASMDQSLEPATSRGLAATLLQHLPSVEVTSIAGSDKGPPSVMVDTADPSLEVLHVAIGPADPDHAVRECGLDSGYRRVSCETEPNLVELVARKNDDSRMPSLMGRYYDDTRGSVLVQVWGSDSADTRRLVIEVLADPLLGAQTTAELNDEGEQLRNFEDLQTEVSVSVG